MASVFGSLSSMLGGATAQAPVPPQPDCSGGKHAEGTTAPDAGNTFTFAAPPSAALALHPSGGEATDNDKNIRSLAEADDNRIGGLANATTSSGTANNNNSNSNNNSNNNGFAVVTTNQPQQQPPPQRDEIAEQIESLRKSAVDITKEQNGTRQLVKKYQAEAREWETMFTKTKSQLAQKESELLTIQTAVDKCTQMKTFFEEKFRMADAVVNQIVEDMQCTKQRHEDAQKDYHSKWQVLKTDFSEKSARQEEQLKDLTRRLEATQAEKRTVIEEREAKGEEAKDASAKVHAVELKLREQAQKHAQELSEAKQEEKRLESMVTHKHTEVERVQEALFALKAKHADLQAKHDCIAKDIDAHKASAENEADKLRRRADAADAARDALRSEAERLRGELSAANAARDMSAQTADALQCDLDMARAEHGAALARIQDEHSDAVADAAGKHEEALRSKDEAMERLQAQVAELKRALGTSRTSACDEVRRATSDLAKENRVQIEQLQKRNDAEKQKAAEELAMAHRRISELETALSQLERGGTGSRPSGAATTGRGGGGTSSKARAAATSAHASPPRRPSGGAGTTATKAKAAGRGGGGGASTSRDAHVAAKRGVGPTTSGATRDHQPAPSTSTFTFARRKKTAAGGGGGTAAAAQIAAKPAGRRPSGGAPSSAWPTSPPHDPFFDF